jgi:DNA ligase-associated metallophosphoesterase
VLEIELAGERLQLHADRALAWPSESALVIADVHLGKDLIFQRHGIAIPNRVSRDQLDRITALLLETEARRLVILGDFLHGRLATADALVSEMAVWRERHRNVEMDLIVGNHDRTSVDTILRDLFDVHDDVMICEPFRFAHEPTAVDDLYTLAGHLHPGFSVRAPRAGAALRLPAFWFRSRYGVLPAFGTFTGLARVRRHDSDRVFVVGEGNVAEV